MGIICGTLDVNITQQKLLNRNSNAQAWANEPDHYNCLLGLLLSNDKPDFCAMS